MIIPKPSDYLETRSVTEFNLLWKWSWNLSIALKSIRDVDFSWNSPFVIGELCSMKTDVNRVTKPWQRPVVVDIM